MVSIKLKVGQEKISKAVLKELGDKSIKVIADCQNRTAAGMRTDATRLIVKESGILRKKVFDSFTIIKASPQSQSPQAKVIILGNPIGLAKYKHKPKGAMKGVTKGGVLVNLGRTSVKFRHAFVAVMPNGHVGIFERVRGQKSKTGKELIKEFFGPSIPQIAARDNIVTEVQNKGEERFIKRFEQQSARWLKQKGAK